MIVTINTDASFRHFKNRESIGAFAFYIVCNGARIKQSGVLKQCVDPLDAELQAIGNAFYALLSRRFHGVTKIIVNTDCLFAIMAINKKKKIGNKQQNTLKQIDKFISGLYVAYPKKQTKRKSPFIEFRHVKAHQTILTKRQWVNDWCDRSAKEMLRNHINEQNAKNNNEQV